MGEVSSEINGRLRKLLREFSQAEISRRCEISPSNLSRYVNGQRVPAEVCSAIVRNLGVSPLWLLTGEGPTFTVQVDPRDAAAVGLRRLLDQLSQTSVRALDAVPKALRGGEIANLRRDLSELDDVQRQLHGGMKELYESLLKELINAMDAFENDRVERILQQLRDLQIVCNDPALVRQRRDLEAVWLVENKRPMQALEIQRAVFAEAMASFGDVGKAQLMQEFNFIATLRSCGCYSEARAYARALTELRKPLVEHEEYWLLRALGAFIEIELGKLSAGLDHLTRAVARLPELYKHANYSLVTCAHLLQGALSLESARASEVARVAPRPPNERVACALSLLRFGVCIDAMPALARILDDFADVREFMTRTEGHCVRYAEAAADVERGARSPLDAMRHIAEGLPDRGVRHDGGGAADLGTIDGFAMATRFAVLHALPPAADLWRQSQAMIDALGPERMPRLLTRWLHARNTLDLNQSAAAATVPTLGERAREAQCFLTGYVTRGFAAFAVVPDEDGT